MLSYSRTPRRTLSGFNRFRRSDNPGQSRDAFGCSEPFLPTPTGGPGRLGAGKTTSNAVHQAMSCYFRYIRELFTDAGISLTPENKKVIDQAIHKIVRVKYKKCMPDCWGEVKKQISDQKGRSKFLAELKKSLSSIKPAR